MLSTLIPVLCVLPRNNSTVLTEIMKGAGMLNAGLQNTSQMKASVYSKH